MPFRLATLMGRNKKWINFIFPKQIEKHNYINSQCKTTFSASYSMGSFSLTKILSQKQGLFERQFFDVDR